MTTPKPARVVAIDGPAASGKSTVSRAVARLLGFCYVDSGAMYRTVVWKAVEQGIVVEDEASVVALLRRLPVSFQLAEGEIRMLVDGVFPGAAIRSPSVTEKVSPVAAMPEVRRILVEYQRSLTRFGSLVMEGRDIGSVVFPHTPFKFYLDADPQVRAQRRQQDLQAMQIPSSQEGVARAIQQRDLRDAGRQTSPLQVAPGARIIDSSRLSAEQVVRIIVDHVRDRAGAPGTAGSGDGG